MTGERILVATTDERAADLRLRLPGSDATVYERGLRLPPSGGTGRSESPVGLDTGLGVAVPVRPNHYVRRAIAPAGRLYERLLQLLVQG